MDNISLVETDKIDGKIQMILRQTDYTEEKAREKLGEFQFDEMSVIRDYLGLPIKPQKQGQVQAKSVNQEIYKQIRGHLDGAMRDYRDRVDKGEAKKII